MAPPESVDYAVSWGFSKAALDALVKHDFAGALAFHLRQLVGVAGLVCIADDRTPADRLGGTSK
jgi:hypothetical protein